jgi:hydroxypyruvate isomerase
MPRFAANLSMMYTEVPFLDRFAAAARDGFEAVEYLFPYDFDTQEIAQRLADNGLTQALFNLPPGDWAAGERGMACIPGREAEFAASVEHALPYALATGCKRLHAMAGLRPAGVDDAAMRQTYVGNLKAAARRLAAHGITLLIEPINTRDMPGFYLNWQQQAHDLLAEVAEPNLKVQMDLYHCQIMEGDLSMRLKKHVAGVGHVQIAGVPDRHEPDGGEVNYPHLFDQLDALGYDGFVGCEYRPKAGTSAGLGWLRRHLASTPKADA